MIKLIASDLDGTLLLRGAQQLRPETCGLIHELKTKKNIVFLSASGRQLYNQRNLFAPVADEIVYICENGCLTFYEGEILHQSLMDHELGQQLMRDIAGTPGAEILLSGVHTCYVQPKKMSYYYHMKDVVRNHVTLVNDIFATREPYFKISIYEEGGVEPHISYWKERYGEKLHVVTGGNCWLDIMPKGVDKRFGMEKILNRLGIAPDECMAFGDNYNDQEMLEYVGFPVSMETAVSGIYEKFPNHVDTVEHALEKILADS